MDIGSVTLYAKPVCAKPSVDTSSDRQAHDTLIVPWGRASDAVVGQIQRYMGYVKEDVAEDHQRVRGVIIALDDDKRIRRALQIAQGIEFYRYEVKFSLIPAL